MKYWTFWLLLVWGSCAGATRIAYYHTDRAGSSVAVTDEDARIVWRAHFRPYGQRDQSATFYLRSTGNPLWFAGHEGDAATGLYYMQARYMSPVLGRFLSVDPAGFSVENLHSFNRYAYANNNPYRYADPDGRESVLLSVRGTAATGFGVSAGFGVYISYPGRNDTPWDAGLLSTGSLVAGADVSATVNVALLSGGRENLEGPQVTASATLPVAGVGGPAIDVEHVINPITGESAGAAVGVGIAAFPNASVSVGQNVVVFSARDALAGDAGAASDGLSRERFDGSSGGGSIGTATESPEDYTLWFDHIAL